MCGIAVGHLEVFFRGTPWAIPLTGLACLLLIPAARPLSRWLRVHAILAWLLCAAIAGYLSVTVTPSNDAGDWSRSQSFSGQVEVLSPRDLMTLTSESLNVWVTVPVGFLAILVAALGGRVQVCAVVVALPALSEGVQYAVPALGRSAFLLTDVVANWAGVILGAVPAALVGVALLGPALLRTRRPS